MFILFMLFYNKVIYLLVLEVQDLTAVWIEKLLYVLLNKNRKSKALLKKPFVCAGT